MHPVSHLLKVDVETFCLMEAFLKETNTESIFKNILFYLDIQTVPFPLFRMLSTVAKEFICPGTLTTEMAVS